MIRAAYDAAKTTDENRRHWAAADDLSAVADGSASVRKALRTRARYEVANNSIARGIVLTLANDVVGTGPRLQLRTDNTELNRAIEQHFAQWASAVRLAEKLRTMRKARAQDGEAFAVFVTNRGLDCPVKLDIRLIEADRISTPTYRLVPPPESKAIDGIQFDEAGNPEAYHVLRSHPGAVRATVEPFELYDRVPAALVMHWFRTDRPGQRRGIPDLTPALPLFALLRRFTLATLNAAETAADLALVMKTNTPAGGEAAEVEPWVTMEIERNMAMFAPEGWEPMQMKAEHPAGTFEPFRRAIISEIARCLNMPYNIAACDSSDYNYASGRLDHQTYFKSTQVEQSGLVGAVLDRVFTAWLAEALRVADYGLFGQIERLFWPREWLWTGREHVDPLKEAKAADILLKAGLMTEAEYHGRQGRDWEEMQDQRKREAEGRATRKLAPLAAGATTEIWNVGETADAGDD